jgi:hypothetical protein
MAKLGFGLLMVMQNEWPKAAADILRYREIAESAGHAPRPPISKPVVSAKQHSQRPKSSSAKQHFTF